MKLMMKDVMIWLWAQSYDIVAAVLARELGTRVDVKVAKDHLSSCQCLDLLSVLSFEVVFVATFTVSHSNVQI
jgi:hypothetical protein